MSAAPALPESASTAESLQPVESEELRFVINASATDSVFVWNDSPLNEIDIKARGVAYGKGADVHELRIDTPIGYTAMTGKITNWEDLTYDIGPDGRFVMVNQGRLSDIVVIQNWTEEVRRRGAASK